MSKKLKEMAVTEFSKRYQTIDHCFIVNYRGMSASKLNNFRSYLKEKDINVNVIKNAVLKHTLTKLSSSFAKLNTFIDGPIAVIYSPKGDGVSTIKRLVSWVNKNKLPEIKGGYVEGNAVNPADIKKIALVPSREVLLTQLAIMFKSPSTRLARVLSALLTQLGYDLNQVASRKE